MNKIKYALSAGAASAVLSAGLLVAPVSAQSASVGDDGDASATNNSVSYSVSGDCSGVIFSTVNQVQETQAVNMGGNIGGNDGGANGNGADSNSQSNTQSNTQSNVVNNSQTAGVTFNPDCSVNNVTNVTQAAAAATVTQVASVPKGGVKAGLGGAADANAFGLLGFSGSIASAGYGLLRLRLRRG